MTEQRQIHGRWSQMSSPDNDVVLPEDGEQRRLGRNLRDAREHLGLSQETVAERLGIPRPSISAVETGRRKVSSLELKRFAQLYERSIDALFDPETSGGGMSADEQYLTGRSANAASYAMLVNGTDLTEWANRRVAQSELPRVMRRIIHGTAEQVRRIGFPADEGVQLGGWDGIVEVAVGNVYVPEGVSVWELGTNGDIRRKANGDYDKRTDDPGDLDAASATFISVTPRRWGGKDAWIAEKLQEGVWKDVRAYDGDDLAAWLELAPGVHLWLSLLVGKYVDGAQDLLHWWRTWSSATRPPLTANVVTGGRDAETDRIRTWLQAPPSLLSIQGENRDGALAFVAAALDPMGAEEDTANLARCIVVENASAWRSLSASGIPLVLMHSFEDRTMAAGAVASGHHVLVPLGNGEAVSGNTVELPRPHRDIIRISLLEMGISEAEVDALATTGRRSLAAMRRKLAFDAAILSPRWARANEAPALLPALLAGRWDNTNDGDRNVLARLAGSEYASVSATLTRWANEPDPPVRRVGNTWMLASREDAWPLLSRYLTRDELQRFATVVAEILGQLDPRFDLPVRERGLAHILGKVPAQSGHLREGIAETLGVMAAHSDTSRLQDAASGQEWSDRIVRQLFAEAGDWRVWASLAWLLPLLAEASPRALLHAVGRALAGDSKVLADLFTDHDGEFGTFDSSPHTGLLWALEVLCWSPDYLGEAALHLASLDRIDPGGRLGNRPMRSLRNIFLSWHPQTAAPAEQRLHVLDRIRQREPGCAWRLMTRLLPEMSIIGEPTSKPRWRDWVAGAPDDITWGEVHQMAAEIAARLLEDVGTNGHRWSELIGHVASLPQDVFEAVAHRLNDIDPSSFSPEDRKGVWGGLRAVIARHVEFADAKWAMTKEQLALLQQAYARFEPDEPIEKYGWLFSDNPALMVGRDKWEERARLINEARTEAARVVYAEGGVQGLMDLAARTERPLNVGHAIGLSGVLAEDEDVFLWQHLGSAIELRRYVALGYLAARIAQGGDQWLAQQASSKFAAYAAPQQLADFYCHWPFIDQTWDRLDTLDEETRRLYWRQVTFWGLGDAEAIDHERVVANFFMYGRFDAAIHFISLYAREEGPRVSLATVADVLHAATQEGTTVNWGDLGYDVAKLLDLLDEWEEKDEARLASIEWFLLPVLRHYGRPPRTLHRALATQPEFFGEVLKWVFRARGEEPKALTPDEEARARVAYELLHDWHDVPGLQSDGGVDEGTLATWVSRAREIAGDIGRGAIGDQQIGQILSSAPKGTDDVWPHEAVRDLLDDLSNDDLDLGLQLGVYNGRGVTTRAMGEGGDQERVLVEKYRGYARRVRDRWPHTAHVLEQIAGGFERDARREDVGAELEQDLWR